MYPPDLMERINRDVVDGFYAFRKGGLEVGGLLYGRRNPAEVEIFDFQPISCQHAMGPGFRLSAEDRNKARAALHANGFDGLEPVGLYRSVTRGPVAVSADDLQLLQSLVPKTPSICLLMQPDAVSPTRANFFYSSESGRWITDQDSEMLLSMGRPPAQTRSVAPDPRPKAGNTSTTRTIAEDSAPPELWVPPALPARPKRRVLRAFAAIFIMLAAAAIWWGYVRGQASLGLTLSDSAGQLHVQWSQTSAEVTGARRGWVEIRDGATHILTEFTAAELRQGSLYFVRRSDRTQVRLVVENANGGKREESATIIGR